ncbi:MAG TPA: hypothetical protein PKJ47_10015 [Candidatus Limiplasma sp.]|nr:hypothetical protein [Candidatus Limiplasma sp.]
MASNKEDTEKLAAASAASYLKSQAATSAASGTTAKKSSGTTSSSKTALGGITGTYYTTPSTSTNYENNKPTYTESQAVKDAWSSVNNLKKPSSYVSKYGDQIQSLIDKALNRKSFSYDSSTDPLYQQYSESYQRQGQQASRDAIGQAVALSGGYGNSYAQSVGQQTYQEYLSKLNDMLPELRSDAYQQYQDEGTTLNNNITTLQNQESVFYNQYRDSVSDYNTELEFLYNAANDMSEQEYNRYENDLAAWQADRTYWYQKAQDDYTKSLAAATSSKRSSGGSSKKSSGTSYSLPTSYNEYAALTGDSGIMTNSEWTRRKSSGSSSVSGTNSYSDYLKAMIAKRS